MTTGAGFEPGGVREGTGLLGMRERAVLIGAELELRSASGGGTSVRLRLASAHDGGAAAARR